MAAELKRFTGLDYFTKWKRPDPKSERALSREGLIDATAIMLLRRGCKPEELGLYVPVDKEEPMTAVEVTAILVRAVLIPYYADGYVPDHAEWSRNHAYRS